MALELLSISEQKSIFVIISKAASGTGSYALISDHKHWQIKLRAVFSGRDLKIKWTLFICLVHSSHFILSFIIIEKLIVIGSYSMVGGGYT